MKKFLISALVLSSALAAPAFAFAQNNAPITRAQVKAELIQLEKAGYSPGGEDVNYPQDLQAAEQRVSEQQGDCRHRRMDRRPAECRHRACHVSVPRQMTPPQSIYFGH